MTNRWLKPLVDRYVAGEGRIVQRMVRSELARSGLAPGPGDAAAVTTLARELAAARQELAECKAAMVLQGGLNQSGFRDHIAYRSYDDDAIFINIGAGSFSHQRWTNLDVSSDHYESHRVGGFLEYDMNAEQPMPFDTSSVSIAYTSHAIEHVKDGPVTAMFAEVQRVLKPGGVFRVTCPDAHLYYDASRRGLTDRYFYRMNTWFRRSGTDDADVTPVDFISKGVATGIATTPLVRDTDAELHESLMLAFEQLGEEEFLEMICSHVDFSIKHVGRHINWWTHGKVQRLLDEAGFSSSRPSTFGGSIAAPLCDTSLFDNTVRDESLYVEATR